MGSAVRAGDRDPSAARRVVQPHLDRVPTTRQVGRQRNDIIVGKVFASNPAISRPITVQRQAVNLSLDLAGCVNDVHEDFVGGIGGASCLPDQSEMYRPSRLGRAEVEVATDEQAKRAKICADLLLRGEWLVASNGTIHLDGAERRGGSVSSAHLELVNTDADRRRDLPADRFGE